MKSKVLAYSYCCTRLMWHLVHGSGVFNHRSLLIVNSIHSTGVLLFSYVSTGPRCYFAPSAQRDKVPRHSELPLQWRSTSAIVVICSSASLQPQWSRYFVIHSICHIISLSQDKAIHHRQRDWKGRVEITAWVTRSPGIGRNAECEFLLFVITVRVWSIWYWVKLTMPNSFAR